ncbi:MAG: ABC transporter ATP-binding protein [Burkholderiales bacterium]|jgi:branched-chain amino acid transport system ATP-binding protein
MSATLLAVDRLVAGYGDAIILEDVSLELAARASLALLGRNGVGKTTLIASLLGLTRVHRGTVSFDGADVTAWRPYARAHAGMGWVPQERDIFPSLTVQENLTVIARPGPWTLQRVYGLFPRLNERSRNLGNQLSGGEQQMLAIGRALMLNPKLLLLDEPFEGLAPNIVAELEHAIGLMMSEGIAMLLVEQHVEAALRLSENAVVLERGRVVHAGPSAGLRQDRALLESLIAIPADRA